jgi:GNAT superfamily N-acetyltransferase
LYREVGLRVQIELLADRADFIPALAKWHYREWAYLRPGDSVENRVSMLRERSGRSELPITYVASSSAGLLGSAMLIACDMDTRPEYSPWLAGVFVAPESRRRGVGQALVEHVMRQAAALGFVTLYLYTPSAQNFFLRLGWNILERTNYRGTDVIVMSHALIRDRGRT